jgi:SAM-dependent methyltransferase
MFDGALSANLYKKMKNNYFLMTTTHLADAVIGDQITEYDDDLDLRLTRIGRLFDIPSIINEPQENPHIVNYFEKTKMMYRLSHSWQGYKHFGISYDGKHKREDFKEQERIVERYIRDSDAKNVLELAYGDGINIASLAQRNPDVTFDGVDLSLKPLKRYAKIPNAHFQFGDYHDLSALEDDAYDLVFIIEALCYSTNKLHVFREVKKKLRRDGLFIIIDAYRRDRPTPLSQSEDVMIRLIEKGVALEQFEHVGDVERYMQEEYSIVAAEDFTENILPSTINLERKSLSYFAHPTFARIVNKILPYAVVKNFIVIYLVPTSIRRQVGCYYVHVLKNDK